MKFSEKLVLNSYLLSQFGVKTFEELSKDLKEPRLEHLDENDNTLFLHKLKESLLTLDNKNISDDKLLEYDRNIVRHTKELKRDIRWKYFQYLSLLFVEIYLDKYFNERELLISDLNEYLKEFNRKITEANKGKKKRDWETPISEFKEDELNKIALWNATGSGKTLLMHINLKQFNHYVSRTRKINKTVLITPNEGLSNQHLSEFTESHIKAEIFSKNSQSGFRFGGVEIIEVTKLGEKEGDKTVAVESFEDNNLVFIDEGHRGSSGDVWKINRDKLSKKGFSFEYSATFGQAVGKEKGGLADEYSKAILFDYSYKYFYNDGYGKDYTILNLNEDAETAKQVYLTASLLSFYQQLKIYQSEPASLKPYLIEKPLMVFVGASVNAVRKENKRDVSDVVDALLFIDEFIKNKNSSINDIKRITSFSSGLNNSKGEDIFENRFSYLSSLKLNEKELFKDMLEIVFNGTSGILHLENIKGVDGEIALKLGENPYFGVINVGDSSSLIKLCEGNNIKVVESEFTSSLFRKINNEKSDLHILIGSKKFTEGWSSWRVSTMGLMNVGKKEGSQIIQLFGRGVRLKGFEHCLKRSRAIPGKEMKHELLPVETLNIFGLKANYIKEFKEYLEEEGVPADERVEFVLPVIYDEKYKKHKLKVLKLEKGRDFKREVKLELHLDNNSAITKKVSFSLYRQVDVIESKKLHGNTFTPNQEILQPSHLSFVDLDNLFFALQRFKNENKWWNLNISKASIEMILQDQGWYQLFIPQKELDLHDFSKVMEFESIVMSLLKKYTSSFYEFKKAEWESQYLEYRELTKEENKANFIDEYRISIEDKETELIKKLTDLKKMLDSRDIRETELKRLSTNTFEAMHLAKHLYSPLIYKDKSLIAIQIKPVHLNDGEKDFVNHLSLYLKQNLALFEEKEIYLLRNQSKTGLGLFAEANFYPDFIMWVIDGEKQYINFLDPKGLLNLNTKNDPKINLSVKIKEVEEKLADTNVILNSFIISVTPYAKITWTQETPTKKELEDKNVFFQVDDKETYIGKVFQKLDLA